MKKRWSIFFFACVLCLSSACQDANTMPTLQQNEETGTQEEPQTMIKVQLVINDKAFQAQFYDHATTRAFVSTFPVTLTMQDLNGNELYTRLQEELPTTKQIRPPVINQGEIMCYYDNTLVLFYETLENTFGGYTKIGFIENPQNLQTTISSGNVNIHFSLVE